MVEVVALPSIDSRELDESRFQLSIECFCITGSGSKEIVAKGFRTENLNVLPKCKGVRFLKIKKVSSKGGRLSL